MTAKEWLERGRGIEKEIEILREERDKLYTELTAVTPRITADKVQTSRQDTATEKMAQYADYGRLLDDKHRELIRIKTEITDVIYRLDNSSERRILLLRFIQAKPWGEVSEAVGYERRQAFRIYAEAMKKIDEFLKDVTKCH